MAKKRGNNEGSITRRKDGLWMAQVTIGRDPATGTLKRATFYGKTRQDVADKLTKALVEKNQGTLVVQHRLTLGQWLTTWLTDYKKPKIRPLTFDGYDVIVHRHLTPALGHITLKDLRPEHLQHFYNDELARGFSSRTVRYGHTLLFNALTQAQKMNLVSRNVAVLSEPPRLVRKEMRTLDVQQVSRQLLPRLAHHRLFAAIFLLFGTGLRRGELLGLRWRDLDMAAGTMQVKQTLVRVKNHGAPQGGPKTRLLFQAPKTAASCRTVPIPQECLIALKRHRARQAEEKLRLGAAYQDHELIFAMPSGNPLDPSDFTKHFKGLMRQAGLPAIRLHDARHTFATLMLELGESPKTVQTMLGHANVGITLDIYSHVSIELEKRAAARLNAAFTGAESLGLQ